MGKKSVQQELNRGRRGLVPNLGLLPLVLKKVVAYFFKG